MKKLSAPFFITAAGLPLGAANLLNRGAALYEQNDPHGFFRTDVSMILNVIAGAVMMLFFYMAWSAIQDGHARTTPGKAVGFLLIPVFNIYWMFQAIVGFAEDYNKFLKRHESPLPDLPEELFIAYTLLVIAAPVVDSISDIGMALRTASFLTGFLVISKTCRAVNALSEPPEPDQ